MRIINTWVEDILKRRINYISRCLGYRGGRKYYEITFTDGSTKDYFIDFDKKELEEV